MRDYGIFDEEGGYGTRATFTVDKDGRIRHIEQGKEAIVRRLTLGGPIVALTVSF